MTPGCSTCGYAVEWVRTCYSANWRLFPNQLGVLTRGRYRRLPAGTRHYPGFHNLGSEVWRHDDGEPPPALGEHYDGTRQYDSGGGRGAIPPAALLGDKDCIEQGELWPIPLITRAIIDGYDSRCFGLSGLPAFPDRCDAVSLSDPATLLFFATLAQTLYANPTQAKTDLLAYLGPGAIADVLGDGASVIPGSVIGYNGKFAVAVISGTSNFAQLSLQALQLSLGPQDNGQWGTIPLWQTAAAYIHERIRLLPVPPPTPILLVGHSYGGAVAANLAAVYRLAQPTRDVCLLTFGMPKPGDARLSVILAGTNCYNLVNQGDLVPGAPPTIEQLGPLLGVVPLPVAQAWQGFAHAPNSYVLSDTGIITPGYSTATPFSVLVDLINWAFLGGAFPTLTDHFIATYVTRLGMI